MNMEHQMMDPHKGLEDDGMAMDFEGSIGDEDDEIMDSYVGGEFIASEGDTTMEPYEGMEFESEEAAKAFYNSYARVVGFSTRVSMKIHSKRDGAIIRRIFVCAKEGFRTLKEDRRQGKVKRPRAITRVGCKATMIVKRQDSGKWVVMKFEREHNHPLETPDTVHCLRSHRRISNTAKSLIDTLRMAGMGPRGIYSVLVKEYGGVANVGFTEIDCRNYIRHSRQQRTLGVDIQSVLDYLKRMQAENPAFFYAIQASQDQSISTVFWADARARMAYNYFGDAVNFDTTYKRNRSRIPFATVSGVNHHRQPVLFGCAIIFDESEFSFVWLLRTWLAAMSGRHPISFTTDQDGAIQGAVAQVFPKVRHRFCKWHVFRESQEKMANVYRTHPTFQGEFHKCINLTDTIDEFESCWESLVDRYDLRDNEWFQLLYSLRHQWVPVYLRDTFFGETYANQQSENVNSFFDGFVNSQTTPQQLGTQYEKALDSRHEKEVKADNETNNTKPVYKTPSPMEKQAAGLYTRKIFTEFQDELIETLVYTANKIEEDGALSTYRVAKFGIGHKAYTVTFNVFEMRASCSCQMFEFAGVLCRHVLTVFKVRNVLTLPSHYILKRWTKNAKSWLVSDEHDVELQGDCKEALSLRYNNLRHEAVKYAEEGAAPTDIYNVAMRALQDAANKVAAAKKSATRSAQLGAFGGGTNQENNISDGTLALNQISLRNPQHYMSGLHQYMDDGDKEIQELIYKLEVANQNCEAYRALLLMFLKDVGVHEQNLSKKVRSRALEAEERDQSRC